MEHKQDNVSSHFETHEENMTNVLQPIENKTPLRKRKKHEHDLDTAFQLLTKCASTASNDECEDFENIVAKKLRVYPNRIRSAVQNDIMSIFLKADADFIINHIFKIFSNHNKIIQHMSHPNRTNLIPALLPR